MLEHSGDYVRILKFTLVYLVWFWPHNGVIQLYLNNTLYYLITHFIFFSIIAYTLYFKTAIKVYSAELHIFISMYIYTNYKMNADHFQHKKDDIKIRIGYISNRNGRYVGLLLFFPMH